MATHLIASLMVLALIGIIDSGYIYWHHIRKKPLECPINESDCNAVVESRFGRIFGIKNEFLGMIFYLFILIGAFVSFYNNVLIVNYLMIVVSSIAFAFSFYFVYVQKYILKRYCFYCLISAIVNLFIFLNVLLL